jgi:molybdate transport system regulatory protein
MDAPPPRLKLRLKLKAQLMCGEAIAMGPGKADLLAAIAATGSIAAAGRSLGLSYRRTRDMVETLNACWPSPLVHAARGGAHGGGAGLTPLGGAVLADYRALETALESAAAGPAAALLARLNAPE